MRFTNVGRPRSARLSHPERTRPSPDGEGLVDGASSHRETCPEWDSNPHWIGFEPNASASWAIGATVIVYQQNL